MFSEVYISAVRSWSTWTFKCWGQSSLLFT